MEITIEATVEEMAAKVIELKNELLITREALADARLEIQQLERRLGQEMDSSKAHKQFAEFFSLSANSPVSCNG